MNKKSPIIAFLLAIFPGGGLLYLSKLRGLFYTLVIFGLPIIGIITVNLFYEIFLLIFFGVIALFVYIINFIDTAVTASRLYQMDSESKDGAENLGAERFFTIILSFIPGLGHFQLNLVNRGLTLLVSFLGFGVMVFFITFFSGHGEFLLFLSFLLVVWVYGFFDAMQQLAKKERGERLIDRSIIKEFEMRRSDGKRSRSFATILSIFPGAGHLYLGLQKRGIQLMAAFLFSIYILDVLRLGIFLFLIPIIWFYSFFDGMQKASVYDQEHIEDTPIFTQFKNHQKWIGIGLIVLGFYYISVEIFIPMFAPYIHVDYMIQRYIQMAIVCILLIGGGIKLLVGKRQKEEEEQ